MGAEQRQRIVVAAILLLAGCAAPAAPVVSASTVRVGILHSLTGTMEISEATVVNAEKMAIQEINAAGGITVDGRKKKIEVIVEDGTSDGDRFAAKATELITRDKVAVVFGGWTSADRKAVLPMLDEHQGLLFYPVQHEGLESSPNVYYTGATSNQQIVPALDHLKALGKKRLYLVGSEDVFPRTATTEIKAYAAANGMTIVGEQYWGFGHTDFTAIGSKLTAAEPDAVVNALSGDSNVAFFRAITRAGITAAELPVVSLSIAEEEVRAIGRDHLAGHLVVRNYFQTTKSAANESFVQAYQAKYGDDKVTSDPMEAAYVGVHLWAKAVSRAGSLALADVTEALDGLTFEAPEGLVTVDGKTHHVHRTARIGVVSPDGLINEVRNSGKPIAPDPYLRTYPWWKA